MPPERAGQRLACAASLSFAHADGHMEAASPGYFGLLDLSFNIDVDGQPKDANADTAITVQDGFVDDDTTGAFGIGLGYRYGPEWAAVVRYEQVEIESASTITTSTTLVNGNNPSVVEITNDPSIDIQTLMLEGVYFVPYSEHIEFWGLVGLGYAEVETNNVGVTIDGAADAGLCSRSENGLASRVGIGATYHASATYGFYGGVTHTDYGDASFNAVDENNGSCLKEKDSLKIKDVETTDFRIGVFTSF